ncbi:hypothetical protein ACHAQE_010979, partial [Botrytis cinerea]
MGAEVSTLVSTHLQHQTIDEILQDDNILSKLVAAIPSLSSTSRANLHTVKINSTKITRSKSSLQPALQNPKLRPLLNITANHVHLSNNIQSEFSKWLKDWDTFLDVSATDCIASTDLKDILMRKYNLIIQLEKRRTSDRFRWRFFTLFFHDLKVMYTSSGYNANQALDTMVNMLAKADASGYAKDDVDKNVKRWISIGLNWENYLPIKGAAHEEIIAILKSADIKQKSESIHAGMLGRKIRQGLLEPFKWHHLTSTCPEAASNRAARVEQGLRSSAICTPATINYSTSSLDSTGNDQTAMDILSAAAVLERPIPEDSNFIHPTITGL